MHARTEHRWYTDHLAGQATVLLVTNDIANRDIARKQGLRAATMREYVTRTYPRSCLLLPRGVTHCWRSEELSQAHPALVDLLAQSDEAAAAAAERGARIQYKEHISQAELKDRIAAGRIIIGLPRPSPHSAAQRSTNGA